MRILAGSLSVLISCWSVAATAQQFDLECGYGDGTKTDVTGSGYDFASPKHLQIDVTAGVWCENYCSTYDRYEVISATDQELILASPDIESGFYLRQTTYDRLTGILTETTFKNDGQTVFEFPCEEAQFGGFEESRSTPPSAPLTRMMRAMQTKEGKEVSKLAPDGLFNVFVSFEIDLEGTALSCEAWSETPTPELEEATCAFLMDGEFEFSPARNRNGDAVAGEYRTKVVFAS